MGRVPNIVQILFTLSVAAAALFILSGYGYQWEIWSLGTGFTILTNSAYAAAALIILSIGALILVYLSGYYKGYLYVFMGLILTASVFGTARYWQNQAEMHPPIHDITTDLDNPPKFDAMVAVRADAPNPPEYAGEETAATQREAYPDLQPLFLPVGYETTFDAVVALIESRRWELVNADRQAGLVEATEKLPWFGFKDDVVIRIDSIDGESRVDMRSKSRIGRGDLGVNANRIRDFLADLEERVAVY